MGVLIAHMSAQHVCAWYLRRSEYGVGYPGNGVTVVNGHVGVGIEPGFPASAAGALNC